VNVEILTNHLIHTEQDRVIHHIEVCSYPNWIGNAQVRFAKLDGGLLTLSITPMTLQGVERNVGFNSTS
jgi:hypothetical protein